MTEKHIDGLTGQEFASEEEYLLHTSVVTGFKPTDIEHQGSTGIRIAKAALKRTGSFKKNEAGLEVKEKNVKRLKVEDKLRLRKHAIEKERPQRLENVDEPVVEGRL